MKKIVLVLLVLCASVIVPVSAEETETSTVETTEVSETVETTEVPVQPLADADVTDDFTDPAFRQYVVETYGANGRVMASDLAGVTELSPFDLGIQDISGIEHFTSVTNVTLNGNNLGDVSLADFPRSMYALQMVNANVTSINTVGGENIKGLTINKNPLAEIDLSNLTSLINFNAASMTSAFTSVDFSVAPWIQTVTLMATYIKSLDLSMMTNLDGVYISGSLVDELLLPASAPTDDYFVFMVDRTRLEHVENLPGDASTWYSNKLRPLKGIMIDENGHPYIEIHEDSTITNLDELNANGANLVYDPVTSRVTWMDSTSAYDFYMEFNKKILFSNESADSTAPKPLTGYYDLIPADRDVLPNPITPEVNPQVPGNSGYHTVNFLDCDGKLVGQAWPQDGENVDAPSGYTYDASLITNVTSSRDVSPLNCSGGFVIPNTGSK